MTVKYKLIRTCGEDNITEELEANSVAELMYLYKSLHPPECTNTEPAYYPLTEKDKAFVEERQECIRLQGVLHNIMCKLGPWSFPHRMCTVDNVMDALNNLIGERTLFSNQVEKETKRSKVLNEKLRLVRYELIKTNTPDGVHNTPNDNDLKNVLNFLRDLGL